MDSKIIGFHEYKGTWQPGVTETLSTRTEPENKKDRFAVAVMKGVAIVGHLPVCKSGRFAKTVHFFLRASVENECSAIVTGKAVNLGDRKGVTVPCSLKFTGPRKFISLIRNALPKTV